MSIVDVLCVVAASSDLGGFLLAKNPQIVVRYTSKYLRSECSTRSKLRESCFVQSIAC